MSLNTIDNHHIWENNMEFEKDIISTDDLTVPEEDGSLDTGDTRRQYNTQSKKKKKKKNSGYRTAKSYPGNKYKEGQ